MKRGGVGRVFKVRKKVESENLGMVVYVCSSRTQEANAEGVPYV